LADENLGIGGQESAKATHDSPRSEGIVTLTAISIHLVAPIERVEEFPRSRPPDRTQESACRERYLLDVTMPPDRPTVFIPVPAICGPNWSNAGGSSSKFVSINDPTAFDCYSLADADHP
jgi:hypothetical protein